MWKRNLQSKLVWVVGFFCFCLLPSCSGPAEMGTPLPPNEPGDPCVNCWGFGKQFGDGETPLQVELQFVDLQPGEFFDPALDQFIITPHTLIQFNSACRYRVEASDFRFQIIWDPTRTVVQAVHLPTGRQIFDNTTAPLCATDVPNNLVNPGGVMMFGGNAMITWSLQGL